jgi:hypothetical protein
MEADLPTLAVLFVLLLPIEAVIALDRLVAPKESCNRDVTDPESLNDEVLKVIEGELKKKLGYLSSAANLGSACKNLGGLGV